MAIRRGGRGAAPLWYKDAIIYELHVRAFRDSSADGMGDFPGLVEKLDYLRDLGVTAIWLLPFYPSPLKDDGYDIADYTDVHPDYGTLDDFKTFLDEAHRRGLKVITELVLNHTSDQHPWFQRARRAAAGSVERDFYVWSETPARYRGARVIFQDFEQSNWSWDPVAGAYYWHRFYSHQPDLNYDNPAVQRAVFETVDFWLELGVDGLRLDAVPYLYEAEGTPSENLPLTHAFLQGLRRHIDERFSDRMLLAEANQWPEDAVAYFGDGDECHMAFHFPLMPRLFMAVRTEDRFPIVDIMAQTPEIPDICQWALFLRNHDELTLEMVTDEERLSMYRAYAEDAAARVNLGIRRRLAPLLGNNRRKIELMNALLFSLPGTPVLYYGDEIGMGDNVYLGDRNGVRTPMQWTADRNAGFSGAHPQRLYLPLIVDQEYHHATIMVEAQEHNPHSLLAWTKRLIALRKRYQAFGRGALTFLRPANRSVLAFVRRYEDECVLVVANLSRFTQAFELDLAEFEGLVPVEVFGQTPFWPIESEPYRLTLGPHTFAWFSLEPAAVAWATTAASGEEGELPVLMTDAGWEDLLLDDRRLQLEEVLRAYLPARSWYGGKALRLLGVHIVDALPLTDNGARAFITLIRVEYADSDTDTYVLPLAFAAETSAEAQWVPPVARIAFVQPENGAGEPGLLYDAAWESRYATALLAAIGGEHGLPGKHGSIVPVEASFQSNLDSVEAVSVVDAEQNHTSIVFDDRWILKLLRRVEPGTNPELEIGRFLTGRGFAHVPETRGGLAYQPRHAEPTVVAVLHRYVPHDGDAWTEALDAARSHLARAVDTGTVPPDVPPPSTAALLDLADAGLPAQAQELAGPYLDTARLLGRRTAELHHALASAGPEDDFASQPFTLFWQRSIYQSMRSLTGRVFRTLWRAEPDLPEPVRRVARAVLADEARVLDHFRRIASQPIATDAIRIHGDFHLGQVLRTGDDLVIIDFEGEPDRPLAERRLKRSPLRDVASMLRSFAYAALTVIATEADGADVPAKARISVLEPWAQAWLHWVGATYLAEYFAVAGEATFLPPSRHDREILLDAFLLEKAVYELGHELNTRPDWVAIPLRGIQQLVGPETDAAASDRDGAG